MLNYKRVSALTIGLTSCTGCQGSVCNRGKPIKKHYGRNTRSRIFFDVEYLQSEPNIVKFAVVQRHEEGGAAQEHELASFEAMMLPCMDAAHNLARWLLRNEQDAQDVVQEAYLRAFRSFAGISSLKWSGLAAHYRPKHSLYPAQENRDGRSLQQPLTKRVHAIGDESVSPATILERAEETQLIKNAMDGLPASSGRS